jgi:nucleotide-binding universal stress UspA family protein
MSTTHRPVTAPVIVGVDGSDTSLAAVDLAAHEATLRHWPLHVVHAFIWPLLDVPLEPSPAGPPEGGLRNDAERILDAAKLRARTTAPDLAVTGEIIIGAPVPVLLHCARTAALTVIGDRGLGGFTGLLVGSVAVQLAAHAPTPILIARGTPHPDGAIVLGVDGSPANQSAVGYAFETAALRHAPLIALHAWKHPVSTGPGNMPPLVHNPADPEADDERVLAEALAGWQDKYPDVIVYRETPRSGPRKALIEASRGAQLIIVGARGYGGFTGLLLGSVSQAILHHSACPVAIVPHGRRPPASTGSSGRRTRMAG